MQDFFLSGGQLAAILDNAPVGIYVSALDNYELLYVNAAAAAFFPKEHRKLGRTCYQSAGFDSPCPFCKIKKLSRDEALIREYYFKENGHTYQLSGKLIDWGERLAHIEYIEDITGRKHEELRTKALQQEMQAVFSGIPCGLGVYRFAEDRITPVYHNPAFYEIMGYSEENAASTQSQTDFLGVHPEDIDELRRKIMDAAEKGGVMRHTYRVYNDGEGEYRHISLDGSVKMQEDGSRLLYGVYSDVSDRIHLEEKLAAANSKTQDIINSIPGGIAIYRIEGERFVPAYFSDGITELSGHSRAEYEQMTQRDALDVIYSKDRERVLAAAKHAVITGEVLDISYRMLHKNGHLIWIHLNGRRMESATEDRTFYAVFTGMSAETRLFQSIANETADGIYIIDKSNYDLLYANESMNLFLGDKKCSGQKCYEALHGKEKPCSFCTLLSRKAGAGEHEMIVDDSGRVFGTKFRETNWNGIPAYVKYVREITQEVNTKKEIERLEQYFRNIIKKLPGGVAVVRCENDGRMVPEFLSEGFAAMTEMTWEEAFKLYEEDAIRGVHPDDQKYVRDKMKEHMEKGEGNCELVYRLLKGDGNYIWVKNTLSYARGEDDIYKVYAMYRDVTKELKEQERIKKQYQDMLIQHYRMPDPNALIVGHCNITQSRILELIDYTDSDLFGAFGTEREAFFTGISGFVVDDEERSAFLGKYLNRPTLEAYQRGDTELKQACFVKFPKDTIGRYVQITVNLVESPGAGDLTGVLTITDITEQTISDRILHQLSATSYDFVADVNLREDTYQILLCNNNARILPDQQGSHSGHIKEMITSLVVPKDRKHCEEYLDKDYIIDRLKGEGSYSFHYAVVADNGEVLTKNITVSAIDLRLGRICLARTDITESVQEQQGLLNMIAYTFELAGFINVSTQRLTLHTRETVLENLPPYVVEDYNHALERFADDYAVEEEKEEAYRHFHLETLMKSLEEKPGGFDFVFSHRSGSGIRYKQINVLWGDENHRTICLVRADVTDMLMNERKAKKELEAALAFANEANQAKSDFLSAMSHDIRTPMNAIMGMTTLASAHLDDRKQVADWLNKISLSSKHLLSLINDVLDMSKIESSKITLNRMKISLPELTDQLIAILAPQARTYGLSLRMRAGDVSHEHFYGDSLRINQILINILSNAVKFTPPGGKVNFYVDELENAGRPGWARYRFTTSDTGIGMSEEFLEHLFEPFTRSRDSDVGRIEGTGLGLSITKGLVDLMGGSISVESKVNEGTTFHVELEMEYADSGKEDFSSYLPLEVLVVNEEERCCRRIGRTLARAGITSQLVYEPEQITALESKEIETKAGLVLVNGKLLDNRQLQTGNLPVVVLADYDDVPEVRENAKKNGTAYFLNKPFFLTGFHLLLEKIYPDVEKCSPAKVQEHLAENVFAGRHFLVAEDNEINAEILSELMKMYGATVSVRPNGRLAVLAFRESEPETYDAVLMDIQMPEMDGYEAARTIRAQKRPDAGSIPIVAMTANAFAEDVQAALKAGMNAHVAKPIDMEILRETLGRLL